MKNEISCRLSTIYLLKDIILRLDFYLDRKLLFTSVIEEMSVYDRKNCYIEMDKKRKETKEWLKNLGVKICPLM